MMNGQGTGRADIEVSETGGRAENSGSCRREACERIRGRECGVGYWRDAWSMAGMGCVGWIGWIWSEGRRWFAGYEWEESMR